MLRLAFAVGISTALLCACGGGSGKIVPPSAVQATRSPIRGAGAALTIIVPQKNGGSTRRPAYVSPSSAQLVVAVNGGAPSTYALTPQTPGCTMLQANLQCTFDIAAAAGRDSMSLTLEDTTGTVLSRNVVTATLTAAVTTPVNVTLAGIPASVLVAPGSGSGIEDGPTPAYHVPGLLKQPLELEALDADGNIIIGPGAPIIGAPTITSGSSYASVVSAGTTDSNAYFLVPTSGNAGGQTVSISATAQSIPLNDGTQTAPVSASTNFLYTPAVAVVSGRYIFEYSVETQNQIGMFNICSGGCGTAIALASATDAQGDLWVAYQNIGGLSTGYIVEEYPPGYTSPTVAYTNSTGATHTVAVVAGGPGDMLFIANSAGGIFPHHVAASISEYASGASSPTYTITGSALTGVVSVGVDGSGNIYVANSDGTIPVYAGGSSQTTPITTLSDPSLVQPAGIAVDTAGDLYAFDAANQYIVYFAAGSSSATQILSGGNIVNAVGALALDPSGDLFVDETNEVEVLSESALPNTVQDAYDIPLNGYPSWIP